MINELESFLLTSPVRHLRSSHSQQALHQVYHSNSSPSNLAWDSHHLEIDPLWSDDSNTLIQNEQYLNYSSNSAPNLPNAVLHYEEAHKDELDGHRMVIDAGHSTIPTQDDGNATGKRIRTRLQSSKSQHNVSLPSASS